MEPVHKVQQSSQRKNMDQVSSQFLQEKSHSEVGNSIRMSVLIYSQNINICAHIYTHLYKRTWRNFKMIVEFLNRWHQNLLLGGVVFGDFQFGNEAMGACSCMCALVDLRIWKQMTSPKDKQITKLTRRETYRLRRDKHCP